MSSAMENLFALSQLTTLVNVKPMSPEQHPTLPESEDYIPIAALEVNQASVIEHTESTENATITQDEVSMVSEVVDASKLLNIAETTELVDTPAISNAPVAVQTGIETPKALDIHDAPQNPEVHERTNPAFTDTTSAVAIDLPSTGESIESAKSTKNSVKEIPELSTPTGELSSPVTALVKRKLVTIRRISRIKDVFGGNKCLIHIDGWTVLVSKRHDWEVNDLVVYFEIDSFLPNNQWFGDFFSNPDRIETFRGNQGFRVKSFVEGKYLSQGLVYRLDHFNVINGPYRDRLGEVGEAAAAEDLVDKSFEGLLGVTKWEPEEPEVVAGSGKVGQPPIFVVNPGWDRAQNIADQIFSRGRKVWQVTEKLDGVTMQVYKVAAGSKWLACLPEIAGGYPASMRDDRGHVGICGRTEDYVDRPGNLMWATARRQHLAEKIRVIPYPNIALQGEFCGSTIMGNTMKYPEGFHEFVAFGIWNFDTGAYINVKETVRICRELKIKHVPIKGYFQMNKFAGSMETLLAKANGSGSGKHGGVNREIFRVRDELIAHEGADVTFYDFMGVSPSASMDDINKAYKKRSRMLHPDKVKQQLQAERTKAQKDKAKKKGGKPGVQVVKAPTPAEIKTAVKKASERQARLSIVANILRGPGRDRYDHFLANGFPTWKGTEYYYSRYRPGLGTAMFGVFLFAGGGAHYIALYMSWKRQREFVERYIKFARHAAWGNNLGINVPGIDGETAAAPAPPPPPPQQYQDEDGNPITMNRKMRRLQERDAKKENAKEAKTSGRKLRRGGRDQAQAASGSGSGSVTPQPQGQGPSGAKKRVVAENGKVLVVDSLGDVYLEQEDEDGNVAEFLLDPNELSQPTFADTAVVRLPLWAFQLTVGRFLPGRATKEEADEEEEEEQLLDEEEHDSEPGKATPSTDSAEDFELLEKSVDDLGQVKATGSQRQGNKAGKRKNKKR
ncbi:hypothetical protein OQA88_1701 [Cercophora sp. LCS_1]